MSPSLLNLPLLALTQLPGRAWTALDEAVALVPRMTALVDRAGGLITGAAAVIDRIDATRQAADSVTARADDLLDRSDDMLARFQVAQTRLNVLLDALEPPLLRLQPTLERLAGTTDPEEVEAVVRLMDQLPGLVGQLERDVMPVLTTLGSVAPDLHDLLDVSRELNELLGKVPGLGRLKKRVDEEQAEREAEREAAEEH